MACVRDCSGSGSPGSEALRRFFGCGSAGAAAVALPAGGSRYLVVATRADVPGTMAMQLSLRTAEARRIELAELLILRSRRREPATKRHHQIFYIPVSTVPRSIEWSERARCYLVLSSLSCSCLPTRGGNGL